MTKPFVEAITIRHTQSERNFNLLLEMIENEIKKMEE